MGRAATTERADGRVPLVQTLDRGISQISSDFEKLGLALGNADFDEDGFPSAALQTLQVAYTHARSLRDSVQGLSVPSYQAEARTHALNGLNSLVDGLGALQKVWQAFGRGSTDAAHDRQATASLQNAQTELLAAEHALGCPFGCPKPVTIPSEPPFGSTS